MIKAIETQYKGYKFRSRLEARWAVFFDAIGADWEYEKEGYELEDGTRYLPDFWLRFHEELDWGAFIEIKPTAPNDEEISKLYMLAKGTDQTVMAFWGKFEWDSWYAMVYRKGYGGECFIENGVYSPTEQVILSSELIWHEELNEHVPHAHHLPFGYYSWLVLPDRFKRQKIEKAMIAAKSARFEFGPGG